MNLGELDIVWKQKESNFWTLVGRCCWLILYNLLYWVYKRPGRRLKAGQLHEAGCSCLLLREKIRFLLVWNSQLTWATLSWLQRELCFILPTVCWTEWVKWGLIQQRVQSRVRIRPKPAQSSSSPWVISHPLCCVIRNPELPNAHRNVLEWLFVPSSPQVLILQMLL